MVELYEDERIDTLFSEEIKVIQSQRVFSYSVDSVLLSQFPRIPKTGCIFDLCAGNGAVGLFASRKTDAKIIQVELQERLADMASRSIVLNDLSEQVSMHNIDLKDAPTKFGHDVCDLLLVNPPYFKHTESSRKNPNPFYAIARHEVTATLDDICEVSSTLLKTNGRIAMVHRPDRFLEIIEAYKAHNLAPKRLQFVYPKQGKEANMLLIEGIKNGSLEGFRVLPPLIVHEENGEYTEEVRKIYYGD